MKTIKVDRPFKIVAVIILITGVCLGLFIFEAQTKVLRHAIDNYVYDNKNHYLPCDSLPTEMEVNRVLQEHRDMVEAIEKVNVGLVGVEVHSSSCPGKADLLIWYGSHSDRLQIEELISGDTFFGIPYRLNNR